MGLYNTLSWKFTVKIIQSVNKHSIFGSLTNKAKKCNHLYTVN